MDKKKKSLTFKNIISQEETNSLIKEIFFDSLGNIINVFSIPNVESIISMSHENFAPII